LFDFIVAGLDAFVVVNGSLFQQLNGFEYRYSVILFLPLVVLLIVFFVNNTEINEYARVIGIDSKVDQELMYIAREGINAPLPPNWKPW